jgi:hypothetical protein
MSIARSRAAAATNFTRMNHSAELRIFGRGADNFALVTIFIISPLAGTQILLLIAAISWRALVRA